VELHSDLYSDFEVLHLAMSRRGFKKSIISSNGRVYSLPRAEYDILTEKDKSQVLEETKDAVGVTNKSAEILVTESAGRIWSGLTEEK